MLTISGSVHLFSRSPSLFRALFFLFIFFSFLLRALFANFITAFLLSQTNFRLDYFRQLSGSTSHRPTILLVRHSTSHFFFTANFPKLKEQIVLINYEENSSIETLRKVITGKYVLITPREFGEMIQSYYSMFHFHVSKEGAVSTLGNFAMRYGLREDISRKLAKL